MKKDDARKYVDNMHKDDIFELIDVSSDKVNSSIREAINGELPDGVFVSNAVIQKRGHVIYCYLLAIDEETLRQSCYEVMINYCYNSIRHEHVRCMGLTKDQYDIISILHSRYMFNNC